MGCEVFFFSVHKTFCVQRFRSPTSLVPIDSVWPTDVPFEGDDVIRPPSQKLWLIKKFGVCGNRQKTAENDGFFKFFFRTKTFSQKSF